MDLEDFRSVLESAGVDVWVLMDTAITAASVDYADELKRRRDAIVERLYTASSAPSRCQNCESDNVENKKQSSPSTEEKDPYGGLFDDEQKKILEIKQQLEDPNQSVDSLMELLQSLADMDITFQALQETDIGKHVNRLRKHSSNDVKRLVKLLVRKWKEMVNEWMKVKTPEKSTPGESTTVAIVDEDSPQQNNPQNGYHQNPDFENSPKSPNENSGSECNNTEAEIEPKVIPCKEVPPKPAPSLPVHTPAPQNRQSEQKENKFDSERLDSARKRLQENYKEAEKAKKQRTIQVMDFHGLLKPQNGFSRKNKGSNGQGRHR